MTVATTLDGDDSSSALLEDLSNNQVFIDQLNAASVQLASQQLYDEPSGNASGEADGEASLAVAREASAIPNDLGEFVNSHEDYIGKITAIQQKYSELFQEMKRHEREHMKAKKRAEALQKERDLYKHEAKKASAVQETLESLCRQLQKESERIEEEGQNMLRMEVQHRENLYAKFEEKVREIESQMERQFYYKFKEEVDQDQALKERLKTFFEQYELRDAQFQKLLRSKELEIQVHMGRYEQMKKLVVSEAAQSKLLLQQVSTFTQTETELRSQLNVYVEKFKQVEETLNNSNELFLTFRKEMEQMTKKTKKLEKENKQLTKRAETMNKNVLEMAEERTKQQKEAEKNKKRLTQLENLCRALQAERIELENKIAEMEGELQESCEEDDEVDYEIEEYEDDELEADELDDEDDDGEYSNDEFNEEDETGDGYTTADTAHGVVDYSRHYRLEKESLESALRLFASMHADCGDGCPIHNASAPAREQLLRILEEHRREMRIDSAEFKKLQQTRASD
ncbi:myosin-like coiled-coil protein-domain-containing protein [Myxozyma melibiosi]|uniref:Myosin-like coiled-coil protein-domain-containing protein n=1 Tax=Myxozyma melibiosi TaxID=54550 RepID=A0ABR1F750_9ASCO